MSRMTIPWKPTKLGNPDAKPDGILDRFPGTYGTDVTLECTEFTCRCPVTKQPDWATITVHYVVNQRIVESKSVKLFLETYRDTGIFHEHLAWELLEAFVAALDPLSCTVIVRFNSRGGIAITAKASYQPTGHSRLRRARAPSCRVLRKGDPLFDKLPKYKKVPV